MLRTRTPWVFQDLLHSRRLSAHSAPACHDQACSKTTRSDAQSGVILRAPNGRDGAAAALPSRAMPDPIFADPRLAEIYDDLDADRSDLDAYVALAEGFHARSVLDVGCGTGVLACLLARKGLDVIAVDPAAASLAVARRKVGANQVRWLLGDATVLPAMQVDLATMTGNVAQVFLTAEDWLATLNGIRRRVATRRPSRVRGTRPRPSSMARMEPRRVVLDRGHPWHRRCRILGPGNASRGSARLVHLDVPFAALDSVITSDSTLRFRERAEIEASLDAARLRLLDVRDAPDRPGNEFVFVTERCDPTVT